MKLIGNLIYLAVVIVELIALWKIYVKAGQPGWAAIIPIYNLVVFVLNIIKKPIWWIIICIIPIVNILACLELVRRFEKPDWHCILVFLFGFIYIPYLAFTDAKYKA